jgi:hypothetical protein
MRYGSAVALASVLALAGPAAAPGQQATSGSKCPEVRKALRSARDCGDDCRGRVEALMRALDECVKRTGALTGPRLLALISMGGFNSGLGFTCDPFETTCSCKGYFDCKVLDKSGCCSKPVDQCTGGDAGPETCTCEKSPQCSFFAP